MPDPTCKHDHTQWFGRGRRAGKYEWIGWCTSCGAICEDGWPSGPHQPISDFTWRYPALAAAAAL